MSAIHHPFRFGVYAGGSFSRRELLNAARMAEDLGYSVFGCCDHLDEQFAPMVTLSMVAAVTSRIELQPLVLANDFRHPVVMTKEAATLDQLSEGRFSLGLGAGWLAADFKHSGIPFYPPRVRVARVAETIAIFKGLQSGEPFNFEGEYYKLSGMVGAPRPFRSPIPIMVGASGRKLLSLAAQTANSIGLTLGLPLQAGQWQRGPPPFADATDMKIEWIRSAADQRLQQLEIQTTVFAGGITVRDPLDCLRPLAQLMSKPVEQLLGSPHVLAGTVEACIEEILRWRERWGISNISVPVHMVREFAPVVQALHGI